MKYTNMEVSNPSTTPSVNNTNSTNPWTNSTEFSCDIPQFFESFESFAHCYAYFSSRAIHLPILELFLAFSAFLANLLVVILIYLKPAKINVFDQILIAHSIVDGLTGLVDIPLFHIQDLFGYWPMGDVLCRIWSSYDNNINTTTNLHMLYMSWVRYRSIKAPKTFTHEFLIRKPYYVVICIWFVSLLVWVPTVNIFGVYQFSCTVAFTQVYLLTIYNLITWFIPLVGIFLLSLYIIVYLHLRNVLKRSKISRVLTNITGVSTSPSTKAPPENSFRRARLRRDGAWTRFKKVLFDPQLKFTIIVSSFFSNLLPR